MKRIDSISDLLNKCTGCMVCADACPTRCINSITKNDGFRYTVIDESACINCGKCYTVCPIETHEKSKEEQHLFAAYAKDTVTQNSGSSGGIFRLLAEHFLNNDYLVCAAAFEGTTLTHKIISLHDELTPLLKSKYLQSETTGIYKDVLSCLKEGKKIFFCGTPCQVSAMVNLTPKAYRSQLITADFICHGVPSQKVFDAYIKTLEEKHGGKILDFCFRVKDNKYKHAHGFRYTVEKNGKISTVNGIYTNSSFYNAFKEYSIFRNGCYDCQYTTLNRVSDLTLADFWGIEKYDFKCQFDAGVSMIITNTEKGARAFAAISEQTVSKEFPVEYGVKSNHCLTQKTKKPIERDTIIRELSEKGYPATANKYFKSGLIPRIYWLIPPKLRTLIRKLRG